jgi:hypothetical protein
MPSAEQAKRAAVGVGAATSLIGGALAADPKKVGDLIHLQDTTGLRAIGIADLALVPGLLAGRPRWPWMAARGTLNIAIVAFLLRRPAGADTLKLRIVSAALLGVTVQDLRAAVALREAGT